MDQTQPGSLGWATVGLAAAATARTRTPPASRYHRSSRRRTTGASPNAHYVISSPGGGTANGYVNQQDYTNAWATVGGVCTSDGTATVTLWDDGGAAYPLQVGADAVRLVRAGTLCSG
ncbi:MAG TPA: hypothetical protein VL738_22995 [Dactylosporangium sp.]|nr:hypothetical protein [Dactylosporangium sp.]